MKEAPFVFTPEGIKTLTDELKELHIEREQKTRTGQDSDVPFLNERMRELEELTANATVTEQSGPSNGPIETGATVKLRDAEFDEEVEYTVVNRFEADPLKNRLSEESSIGSALISKKSGDRITVEVSGGALTYEILAVDYRNT